MLDLFKARVPFFIRSYGLKIFAIISTLLLPVIYDFESVGVYYNFVICQSILFIIYDAFTQYFYLKNSVYLLYFTFFISSVFSLFYIGYIFIIDSISLLHVIISIVILLAYPMKFYLLFQFNYLGFKKGFYYEIAENLLFLVALLLASIFNWSIHVIVGIFFARSLVYISELFKIARIDKSSEFNFNEYLRFSRPLILTSVINSLITYIPSKILGLDTFGEYSLITRLINLASEPFKILLNANFYQVTHDKSLQNNETAMMRLFKLLRNAVFTLSVIGFIIPIVKEGGYWAIPTIVYLELVAAAFMNNRKMRGITRYNSLYNLIFLISFYLFLIFIGEKFWLMALLFARLIAFYPVKYFLAKIEK